MTAAKKGQPWDSVLLCIRMRRDRRQEWSDRANVLIPYLNEAEKCVYTSGNWRRTAVLRLAIESGLRIIERSYENHKDNNQNLFETLGFEAAHAISTLGEEED